jgi:ATP-dependent DNA helicase RecG
MIAPSFILRRQASHTAADVEFLLQRGAADDLAVFNEAPDAAELAATLVALANDHGGVVVLTPPSTSPDSLADLTQTACLLAQPPLILPLPELLTLPSGGVAVISVPPGLPHVYSVRGVFWTRMAAQNRPLTNEELRRLLLQRDPGSAGFEASAVPGARLGDLDPVRVRAYVQTLSGLAAETMEEVLLSRGCLVETGGVLTPTVAGILLFGRDPQRFLRSAEMIAVRYQGVDMSDEFVRQDIRGTLPQQVRLAEAFVSDHMRRSHRIRGLAREDMPEYPISVVREALVNAVAHRDYAARGEGIRLLMFSDRLQVYSPGRLPGHVTLANLLAERYSRNEAIVQILSDMGFSERLGYGMDRMVRVMDGHGLPPPEFNETAAGFQVTLRNGGELISTAPPAVSEASAMRWRGFNFNPRQEKALQFLAQRGRITNSDYQALQPEVSAETLRRDLADLVDQGILLRVGEKRATYYILK